MFLVAGEKPFSYENRPEPVGGAVVDIGESLPTWLFCVRSSLRERVSSSFAFAKHGLPGRPRLLCYDIGGQLLADMRARGVSSGHMPRRFRLKWHHIGDLTWIKDHGAGPEAEFKQYDIRPRTSADARSA